MARTAARPRRGNILAYFSHSYRESDREVNSFFWRLFSHHGFFFTVDPQSDFFSIPYLESMMGLCSCFVAVIPKRAGAPAGCSSYILFEYGLAVQARKPRLVFVEQGLSSEAFPRDRDHLVAFSRQRLPEQRDALALDVGRLADQVRGNQNLDVRLRQPAGLVIGSTPEAARVYTPEVIAALGSEMARYGRTLRVLDHDFDACATLCAHVDSYDFLVMETRESLQDPWLAAYVFGRAVPTIRVYHLAPGETPASVKLPAVVARHRPLFTDESPVVFWRDQAELVAGVMPHVNKFGTQRIEFHTRDEGLRYFRRAGRSEGKVFVSNAGADNDLAHKVIAGLRVESIDFFHYQVKDAIPVGERWLAELESQIEQSRVFVALLSPEYLKSEWCLYEMQVARRLLAAGRLQLLPFVLDGVDDLHLGLLGISELQILNLRGRTPQDVTDAVISAVDKALRASPAAEAAPSAGPSAPRPRAEPSPHLRLNEDERQALVEVLEGRLTAIDGPQRSAWIRGALIQAHLYDRLAGEDYSGSARTAAIALVTAAEGAGLIEGRGLAVLRLVRALRDRDLVSLQDATTMAPLIARLESLAG